MLLQLHLQNHISDSSTRTLPSVPLKLSTADQQLTNDYYHFISHDASSAALYLLPSHTVVHEFHTLPTNHNTDINSLYINIQ